MTRLRDVWVGNVMKPGSRCVTDGHFLIYRKHAKPALYRKMENTTGSRGRVVTDSKIIYAMRGRWLKPRAYSVELPGVYGDIGQHGCSKPHRMLKSGPKHAWVDERLWRVVIAAVPFDKLTWARKVRAPLRFHYKGDLVALLMCIAPPDWNGK
jgi:hypothetical protein